ncbi:hypothetical protein [Massilia sp. TS11]|uniref:hypothetical protein n=1 Tax=Massilia sp. TS11 TaxID=2908003 RepID=UPI001EDC8F8E|nr:hypothetical protein [Massilia sp. TS11]MCG2585187.1 hypothetical protein [Massilia sp. TS11]
MLRSLALCLSVLCVPALAQVPPSPLSAATAALPAGLVRVEANPDAGFRYPYYLFVPAAAKAAPTTLLVLPNNTGSLHDELAFHEADAARRMARLATGPMPLPTPVLMPVFPRPKAQWTIYTHALDRDVLSTEQPALARLDRQLLAMIDHARARLLQDGVRTDSKVFIQGFSASGMFANRFTFLHPERVKAAVIGSPGGWPLAPQASLAGEPLRYPLGTADLAALSGQAFDLEAVRRVPMFIYMGDQDDNDSLPFKDSYEEEDRVLAFRLLGSTPLARWPLAEKLYREAGLQARFVLYPGVGHTITADMRKDITAFLQAQQ